MSYTKRAFELLGIIRDAETELNELTANAMKGDINADQAKTKRPYTKRTNGDATDQPKTDALPQQTTY
jgi:hypothetical protein